MQRVPAHTGAPRPARVGKTGLTYRSACFLFFQLLSRRLQRDLDPFFQARDTLSAHDRQQARLMTVVAGERKLLAQVDGFTPVIAALPAAVIACVLSHPGDAVLTQFFKDGPQGGGVAGSLQLLMKEGGGPLALFTGLKARLLHVIGIIWVQLIIYDKVKVFLGLPATGH